MIVTKGDRTTATSIPPSTGPGSPTTLRGRGVTRVFVGGLAEDVCVRATALDAMKAGLQDAPDRRRDAAGDARRAERRRFEEMQRRRRRDRLAMRAAHRLRFDAGQRRFGGQKRPAREQVLARFANAQAPVPRVPRLRARARGRSRPLAAPRPRQRAGRTRAPETELGPIFLLSLGGKLYDNLWTILDEKPPEGRNPALGG